MKYEDSINNNEGLVAFELSMATYNTSLRRDRNAKPDDALTTYSPAELQARHQEAVEEFNAGGGMDGEEFFKGMNAYIMSR